MSELFSYIKNSAVASGVSAGVYLSFCFLLAITTNKQKPYVRVIGLEIYLILHGMYSETIISIIREQMSKWGYGENVKSEESKSSKFLIKSLELFANKAFSFLLELIFGGTAFSIVASAIWSNNASILVIATKEDAISKPSCIAIIIAVTVIVFVLLLFVTSTFLRPQLTSPVMDGEEIQKAFSEDLQFILVNSQKHKFAADACATFAPDQNFGDQLTYSEERKSFIVKEGFLFSDWCPIYRHFKAIIEKDSMDNKKGKATT